jgi:GDP-mannose 6-dehydrogenase
MRISVFGLGYVGSVTAACLAQAGHDVIGVDTAAGKVEAINGGLSPIAEPGLQQLVAAVHAAGRLSATRSSEEAVAASDLALICVGTPSSPSGQPDLRALKRVAEQIGAALRTRVGAYTVVLRSTVLPGTTERVILPALTAGCGPQVALQVAVNPEFMREGTALHDFSHPPMTLVGCDAATAVTLQALYKRIEAPFVHTTVRTAEMAKFASNAFHALKISFANELAQVAAALGADPYEVSRVFLLDKKLNVSEAYLRPGSAFGGSCLPKDVRALACAARAADLETPLLASIMPSNEAHQRRGVAEVLGLEKKKISIIGLAFKPGTDDVRESPLLALVETLIGKGCDVRIFDPVLEPASLTGANRRRFDENIPHIASLCGGSLAEVVAHGDVLVIGHQSADAVRARAAARPDQIVVDLTRVSAPRGERESPARDPVSPSLDAVSPSREEVRQARDAVLRAREAVLPAREAVSPAHEAVSPAHEAVSPAHDAVLP